MSDRITIRMPFALNGSLSETQEVLDATPETRIALVNAKAPQVVQLVVDAITDMLTRFSAGRWRFEGTITIADKTITIGKEITDG